MFITPRGGLSYVLGISIGLLALIMDWSNEKYLQMVELYRNFRYLYDPTYGNYKNKLRKEDAWREMATIMKYSREEVKKKMVQILLMNQDGWRLKVCTFYWTNTNRGTHWTLFQTNFDQIISNYVRINIKENI